MEEPKPVARLMRKHVSNIVVRNITSGNNSVIEDDAVHCGLHSIGEWKGGKAQDLSLHILILRRDDISNVDVKR